MTPAQANGHSSAKSGANVVSFCRSGILACLLAAALAPPGSTEPLRIKGIEVIADLPTLIIDRDGRLDSMDIDFLYGHTGVENLASLRAGDVDFALMTMTPLVFDALADADPGAPDDPVILANLYLSHPLVQVLSRSEDLNAPASSALQGKRVAVQKGTIADYTWTLFTRVYGIDPAQVDLVDMPASEMPSAIAEGRIDAAVLWPPWSSRILSSQPGSIIAYSTEGLYLSRYVLVSRRDVLEANPERTDAILQAYLNAVEWLQSDPERTAREISARWPGFFDRQSDAVRNIVYQVSLDWTLYRSFRQQIAWAYQARGENGPLPEFLRLVDPRPLERVHPSALRLPGSLSHQAKERP